MSRSRRLQRISLDACSTQKTIDLFRPVLLPEKVIEHFGMTNAKYVHTPLPTGFTPMPNKEEVNPQHRTLFHIMLGTHPDIAFAVTKLAQNAANPS